MTGGQQEFDETPQGRKPPEEVQRENLLKNAEWSFREKQNPENERHEHVDLGARGMEAPESRDYRAPRYEKKIVKEKKNPLVKAIPFIALAALAAAGIYAFVSNLGAESRTTQQALDVIDQYYSDAAAGETLDAVGLLCAGGDRQKAYSQFRLAQDENLQASDLFTAEDTLVLPALPAPKLGQFKKPQPTVVDAISEPTYKNWVVVTGRGYTSQGEPTVVNWHVAVNDTSACLVTETFVTQDATYLRQRDNTTVREKAEALTTRLERQQEQEN